MMFCNRVVNKGDEERRTGLCYILKVDMTEFGNESNVGNEKKSQLPTSGMYHSCPIFNMVKTEFIFPSFFFSQTYVFSNVVVVLY